ncbi:GIY-YIG nuclease family protein [Flavobacteriaceae bacterium M23B6Z8]
MKVSVVNEFVVYILFSKIYHKTYVGFTQNLIARFRSHNELGTKGWTRNYRPWMVIHLEVYLSKSEAIKREKFLKSGIGREWIKNQIDIPKRP